jgi:hypothetical protein
VASRAAVLASLLPADCDHEKFLHALGILGDPVQAKKRMSLADRAGERLGADAYGYRRAFTHALDSKERTWIRELCGDGATVLDPTAGGGSIPFEADRLEQLSNIPRSLDQNYQKSSWTLDRASLFRFEKLFPTFSQKKLQTHALTATCLRGLLDVHIVTA